MFARKLPLLIAFVFAAFLVGCATVPEAQPPATPPAAAAPPAPIEPAKRVGELALAEGVDLYHQGSYAAAIKKLQESPEIWVETQSIRIEALKHIAFSACLSGAGRLALCRQSFDRILELDPNFELTAAETGHPNWTPVFRQAKQARTNRRPQR